jgi:hypothetical protein
VTDSDLELLSLDELAAAWLEAEDAATRTAAPNQRAEDLGIAYAARLSEATLEELRLAWEAARVAQSAQLIGSGDWAARRRVSELLRIEYVSARDPTAGVDPT